jgi:hypothetical protein
MSTTGAKAPTAAQSISESPWSDDAWVNAANIYGAGEASVTATSFDAGDQTYVLKAYNFDFSSIPAGAVIEGVICIINARYANAAASIDLVQLLDVSRAKGGTNKAGPTALTTSAANYTFGSSSDKWGLSLTRAWAQDADFGVAIGCLAGGSGNNNVDVYIDSVTLEIYWSIEFVPGESKQSSIADEVTGMTQVHALAASESKQSAKSDEAALTQLHILAPAESKQSAKSDQVSITLVYNLAPSESKQAQASDGAALTQLHILAPSESFESQKSDGAALSVEHNLAPSESKQSQLSAEAIIEEAAINLIIAESKQAQKSGGTEADILSESFEGSGFENADWTKQVGDGTVDEDSTEYIFAGLGNQCLKIAKVGPDYNARILRSWASPFIPDVWGEFRLRILSESIGEGTGVFIFHNTGPDYQPVTIGKIVKISGALYFQISINYDGSSHDGSLEAISTGVDYRIRWRYDLTNKSVEAWIDSTLMLSASPSSMSAGMRELFFGDTWTSTAAAFYIDGIKISSAGWPDEVKLAQTHILAAQESAQSQKSDEAALAQTHILAAQESKQASISDERAITQLHELAIGQSLQGQKSKEVQITQVHNLIIGESKQPQSSDEKQITQIHELDIDESKEPQKSDEAALTQLHILGPQESKQSQKSDQASVEQIILIVGESKQAQRSDEALIQTGDLETEESRQSQKSDEATLAQIHQLVAAESKQSQKSDEISIVSSLDLIPMESQQGQRSDAPTIAVTSWLIIPESFQGQRSDLQALSQLHQLIILESRQSQRSDAAIVDAAKSSVDPEFWTSKHRRKRSYKSAGMIGNKSPRGQKFGG